MLWAVQSDSVEVLAGPQLEQQGNTVARSHLLHQPANAVSLLAGRMLMAGHDMAGVAEATRLGDRAGKSLVQILAITTRKCRADRSRPSKDTSRTASRVSDEDYSRNIRALSSYLTPACQAFLTRDYDYRRSVGELRQRVRGIYEIPGRGYGEDPKLRVKTVSDRDWIVTMDVVADEYFADEQVKRALVRYTVKVVRADVDPERNPFGLMLDCYSDMPQRITVPDPAQSDTRQPGLFDVPTGGTR